MTAAAARPFDLARQITVISAVAFMLVAALVGGGVLGGTPVNEAQGGALDSDATYLAPDGPAFSIWSVIYAGLIAYAVWQALPAQRATARQRSMGWLIALTAVLNGLWLVVVQFSILPVTVGVIILLLVALGIAFRVAVVTRTPDDGALDSVLIDGVTGLHLGWVTLATVANTTAWLTDIGPPEWETYADEWGVAVLGVVAIIGIVLAWASEWRVTPGLALGWGLAWLAVGRLTGEPHSTPIGITAIAVGAIVVLVPVTVAGLRLLRPGGD